MRHRTCCWIWHGNEARLLYSRTRCKLCLHQEVGITGNCARCIKRQCCLIHNIVFNINLIGCLLRQPIFRQQFLYRCLVAICLASVACSYGNDCDGNCGCRLGCAGWANICKCCVQDFCEPSHVLIQHGHAMPLSFMLTVVCADWLIYNIYWPGLICMFPFMIQVPMYKCRAGKPSQVQLFRFL